MIKQNIVNYTQEIINNFNSFYKYIKKIMIIVKDIYLCKEELIDNYRCNFY